MSRPPDSRHDMRRAGYKLLGPGTCRACKTPGEWWETTNGFKLLFNLPTSDDSEYDLAVLHRGTCTPQQQPVLAVAQPKLAEQRKQREEGVRRLFNTTGARVVLALYDDGAYEEMNRRDIPAEDVKHELITAANKVRRSMEAGR